MKKKLLIALLTGTMAVAAPVSCFVADATETEVTAETAADEETADETETEKEELKTVGEETDGAITFKLKNSTSKKITGLAIKSSDETEFPENMMAADDSFDLKERKVVFFSKPADENAEETADTSEDKAINYDLHITFEDQTTADVHGIALEDLGTLTIREKDGIVYATYKTKSTKEKKNTYSAEKALADQAAADAAAAEAASQQTESYDSSYDDSNDYSYDYNDYDDSGDDYDGGDDGGDGCLDDGLLN